MLTVLHCPHCTTPYDADERPVTCDVCGAPLDGSPAAEKPAADPERFWEPLQSLFDDLRM